jgi:hypothetical protein
MTPEELAAARERLEEFAAEMFAPLRIWLGSASIHRRIGVCLRVGKHECPSDQERCGLSKAHIVRAEGHPLDATVSRFVGVVGDVR